MGVITLFTCQGCCKNAYSHAKTTEGNQSCDRGKNSSSQKLIKMKNVEVASNWKSGLIRVTENAHCQSRIQSPETDVSSQLSILATSKSNVKKCTIEGCYTMLHK